MYEGTYAKLLEKIELLKESEKKVSQLRIELKQTETKTKVVVK
jgi:hypothetical protein